jgi:Methyltransferase domain
MPEQLLFLLAVLGRSCLLNWAARYYPVLRTLKRHNLLESGSILEIGSGPFGIGTFRKVPFTGCDLAFPQQPVWPMTPMVASAAELPVKNKSYDVVLALDVLEHVPPDLREKVILEALRVARRLVIFGFPCGTPAHDSDRALRETYLSRNISVPVWLDEHMLAEFPDPSLFHHLSGWKVAQFGNESIRFHSWMMRQEMRGLFVRATRGLMRFAPWIVERSLRRMDGAPCYRQVFVLSPVDPRQ